ncbi:cytochrome P450 [Suillus lakei]|nr:cytochrome P450 [Suillus lakei]
MLTLTSITWLDLCLAGVGAYLVKQVVTKKNPAPYPPGPRGWPLVGNISDIPHIKPWLTFAEWGKKYGECLPFSKIMHFQKSFLQVLGRHIIVLNSVKATMEMLDNKGTLYSDRPILHMTGELVGLKNSLPLLPYGDRFRRYRRNFHRVIGNRAAVCAYNEIGEVETHRFLKRVLAKSDELQKHVRHTAGAVILRISHGYEVEENDDPFVDLLSRISDNGSQAAAPGAIMVDILPFLAKVPTWFPGAGFKRIARELREALEEMVSAPAAGIAPMSFTSNLLEDSDGSAEEDHSREMTVSSIYSLFLAMTLFPDVQKKAQAEIDAVVGPDRLPHCVTEDDIHDGYYIPKGSFVMPNIWFMLNDPRTYANPSQFNPERFLAKDGKEPETEPRTMCFGFGRRICPDVPNSRLHLAESPIWISTAMSLAVFDISKVVENGMLSHPKPFKCSIKPRSAMARGLIEQDANY